jgi:hypothetical protein
MGSPLTDYTLVEHCEYRQLEDEMIRNRIAVGMRDSELPEKTLTESRSQAINQAR